MPPNLDIDREKPLDGTMATYAEQVVIHTGRSDWASRIEDDENLPIVKKLKEELGRNGRYSNVRYFPKTLLHQNHNPQKAANTPQALPQRDGHNLLLAL